MLAFSLEIYTVAAEAFEEYHHAEMLYLMYWETFYSVNDELPSEGTLHNILYNCLFWCLLVFPFKSFGHIFMFCFISCLLQSPVDECCCFLSHFRNNSQLINSC